MSFGLAALHSEYGATIGDGALSELRLPLVNAVARIDRCEIISIASGSPYSLCCGPKDFGLHIPLNGDLEVALRSATFQLGNAILICPPDESFELHASGTSSSIVMVQLSIEGGCSETYLDMIRRKCSDGALRVEHESLKLLSSLVGEKVGRGPWIAHLLEPTIRIAIIAALQRQFFDGDDSGERANGKGELSVRRAECFIEANFGESSLSLDEIALRAGVTSRHLNRLFKKLRSKTAMQYLSETRLERARELLLKNPESQIKEVAFACGFSSSSYFANCYRGRFCDAPSERRILNV